MEFKFDMQGYFAPYFEIIYINETLEIASYDDVGQSLNGANYKISTLNNKEWNDLVRLINTLNWEKKYYNENILDGIQWSLFFKTEHKNLNCFGSNQYPEDFDQLLNQIKKLTSVYLIPFNY